MKMNEPLRAWDLPRWAQLCQIAKHWGRTAHRVAPTAQRREVNTCGSQAGWGPLLTEVALLGGRQWDHSRAMGCAGHLKSREGHGPVL